MSGASADGATGGLPALPVVANAESTRRRAGELDAAEQTVLGDRDPRRRGLAARSAQTAGDVEVKGGIEDMFRREMSENVWHLYGIEINNVIRGTGAQRGVNPWVYAHRVSEWASTPAVKSKIAALLAVAVVDPDTLTGDARPVASVADAVYQQAVRWMEYRDLFVDTLAREQFLLKEILAAADVGPALAILGHARSQNIYSEWHRRVVAFRKDMKDSRFVHQEFAKGPRVNAMSSIDPATLSVVRRAHLDSRVAITLDVGRAFLCKSSTHADHVLLRFDSSPEFASLVIPPSGKGPFRAAPITQRAESKADVAGIAKPSVVSMFVIVRMSRVKVGSLPLMTCDDAPQSDLEVFFGAKSVKRWSPVIRELDDRDGRIATGVVISPALLMICIDHGRVIVWNVTVECESHDRRRE
jgi:hypothetical protein